MNPKLPRELNGGGKIKKTITLIGLFATVAAFAEVAAVTQLMWGFDFDTEGWVNASMMTPFAVQEGILSAKSTGIDPFMIGPTVLIEARGDDAAYIRMKVSSGNNAQIFWIRKDSDYYSESKSMVFKINPDGEFHVYEVKVGQKPQWNGTITQIRLDPTDAAEAAIYIDYISMPESALLGLLGLCAIAQLRRVYGS